MKRPLIRLATSLLLLWFVLTAVFFTIHLAPGDPTQMFFQPGISPEARQNLIRVYGLDRPLHIQYLTWLGAFFQGNFGVSYTHHRPVTSLILETLPRTLALGGFALFIDFSLGIFLGILSAIRHRGWTDRIITWISFILFSVPGFWLGLMALILFAYLFPVFPPSGMHRAGHQMLHSFDLTLDFLHHLLLPGLVLGISGAAATNRFMRQSMLDTLSQPFMKTAQAKGLSKRRIIFVHALPNAILPIITLAGMSLPFLVSGSLIIEVIFAWPGMGRLTYSAMMERDYPLIIGTTFVAAVMVVLGNLLADVMYAVVDPRIRRAS